MIPNVKEVPRHGTSRSTPRADSLIRIFEKRSIAGVPSAGFLGEHTTTPIRPHTGSLREFLDWAWMDSSSSQSFSRASFSQLSTIRSYRCRSASEDARSAKEHKRLRYPGSNVMTWPPTYNLLIVTNDKSSPAFLCRRRSVAAIADPRQN